MSIAADSRYALAAVWTLVVGEGATDIVVFAQPLDLSNISITYYISAEGERFDTLAQRFFNDGTKWWVIANLNPEVRWPGTIPGGSTLRIPLVSDSLDLGVASTINDVLKGGIPGV